MNKIETVVGTVIIPSKTKILVETSSESKQSKLDKQKQYNKKKSDFGKILKQEIDKLK